MWDDIGKFLFRLIEKNSDDFVRQTSQLWDNFLVRVAGNNFFRFLFKESQNGKEIFEIWVIPSTIGIVIVLSLVIALSRKRFSIERPNSDIGQEPAKE
jgi:hypothetical protein